MAHICIVICIGVPGAGKTTFCKLIQNNYLDEYHFIYINYDDLSEGNYSASSRQIIFEKVETVLQSHVRSNRNTIVLIDDNMYYNSMQRQYYKLAKKYNTCFLQIYFEVELQTAFMRNDTRKENKVPIHLIQEMANKIEKPEKHCFIVNSNMEFNDVTMEKFYSSLKASFSLPIYSDCGGNESVNTASRVHNIDLLLRKIVNQKIKQETSFAHKFITIRKELLEKIKRNEIYLPEENSDADILNYFCTYFE